MVFFREEFLRQPGKLRVTPEKQTKTQVATAAAVIIVVVVVVIVVVVM